MVKLTETFTKKILDDFVTRFYNGDYVISPEASKIVCVEKGTEWSLRVLLTHKITDYATCKSNLELVHDEKLRKKVLAQYVKTADKLLFYLTHARNNGVISEGESFISKMKTLEVENLQLKERLSDLQKLNEKLTIENNQLSKLFPDISPSGTEYGDVE